VYRVVNSKDEEVELHSSVECKVMMRHHFNTSCNITTNFLLGLAAFKLPKIFLDFLHVIYVYMLFLDIHIASRYRCTVARWCNG